MTEENVTRPLCRSKLTVREKAVLLAYIDPLTRFLGEPGDWGYGTKLADLTIYLHSLRGEIERAELADDLNALVEDAERYQIARTLSPAQWAAAWAANISTGKPFDQIVDELRPFAEAAMARREEK